MSPRTVLITGSNRGLGLEFVKQFLRLPSPPVHLFATCRDPTKAQNLQELAKFNPCVKILKLDVTDVDNIHKVKYEIESILQGQGLNLLLNNAGKYVGVDLTDVTSDVMVETYRVNTVGSLLTAQIFLPLLQRAAELNKDARLSWERAAIFNISCYMGSIEENTTGGSYAFRASKSALNHITRNLSIELEKDGILAAVFNPGWIVTDMGGPEAYITTEQSVLRLFKVFHKTDETCKGRVMEFTGEVLPW